MPCTAVMTGFVHLRFNANGSTRACAFSSVTLSPFFMPSANLVSSSPAVKCLPKECSTPTRSSGSSSSVVKASASSENIFGVRPLYFSGRSIPISSTWPWRVTVMRPSGSADASRSETGTVTSPMLHSP